MVYILDLLTGIGVFFGITTSNISPKVATPKDSGTTSTRTISFLSFISPTAIDACMAAPIATTSSGFIPAWGFFPKNSSTTLWTRGMRVCPPTSITSSISSLVILASSRACLISSTVLFIKPSAIASSLALVKTLSRLSPTFASGSNAI